LDIPLALEHPLLFDDFPAAGLNTNQATVADHDSVDSHRCSKNPVCSRRLGLAFYMTEMVGNHEIN